jgi:lipopolysaccharide biosynthesis protein
MKKMFEYDTRDDDLGFFAGSMFWVRSDIILQMLPQVDPEGYEPEQGQRDGTLAHALERLVPMVASKLGYLVFEGPMNPEVTLQRALTYY